MKQLIILDFNRTLYDPDTDRLIEGAREFLEDYSKHYTLALIAKGGEARADIIDELGIGDFFASVVLKAEKELSDFSDCLKKLGVSAGHAWSIGDRIKKEIVLSNKAGIKTIWLKQGKFAEEGPEHPDEQPAFVVRSFAEIREIIPLES